MPTSKLYIDAVMINNMDEGFELPIGVRWRKTATTETAARNK
jgi:hypothetical protein